MLKEERGRVQFIIQPVRQWVDEIIEGECPFKES